MGAELEKNLNNEEVEHKETIYLKCSSCGANMSFDPTTQALKCMHCGNVEDFAKSKNVEEIDMASSINLVETWDDDSAVYRCDNCGAVVVLLPTEISTFCPYCKTSHIVKSNELAGIKPNAVYPFTIVQSDAVSKAKAWAKKRLLAPKKFKKSLTENNVKGVYEPCFTFDSKTYSTYVGRIGDRRTRVVGSGKNKRVETYIVWRRISGVYAMNFDDVMINATTTYKQKSLDKILPFDYSTINEYDKKLLTGFVAKRHDRDLPTCWEDAKDAMSKTLRKLILSQYVYDVVDYLNVSTNYSGNSYKSVLLPIYHMSFKYGKKDYGVLVNGNTGKVTGKTPLSPLKLGLLITLGLAVVGLLLYSFFINFV